ncbi:ABC transporter permease [Paenibacillus eucommiae]|uniref:ABC-type polysaccharide transport system permease subunit n=1 Tax=Paenibacillus eucommiae TaxID=1355755 RepID=A0ABS4IVX9_9BACL|nr:ABC transporter permease subunit [Paenibacillus eucommiae]MBP1991727.1 ABC-type polysaccharide transport system permease subunit [Paenibacillus eucommiae]
MSTPQQNNVMQKSGSRLRNWQLYALLLLPVAYIGIFNYWPMYGLQLAFKDFSISKGIWDSPWVGLKHFQDFYNSYQFGKIIKNTVIISVLSTLFGFPAPIILAIALNELRSKLFSKSVQMVTYAPYFISTVVLVGMIYQFLDPQLGPLNQLMKALRMDPINFVGEPAYFIPIYVLSGMWQFTGYSAIIYLAVLSGVDPEIQEAATIDGATKLQRIWHVDLPYIMPTAMILLILSAGNALNVDFEKIFLMQNPLTLSISEVISTYVYKIGLQSALYSFATAIGLFSAVANVALLLIVNKLAKKVTGTSLF